MKAQEMVSGRQYIRITFVRNKEYGWTDYSFTSDPITFMGFTDDGRIIMQCCFPSYHWDSEKKKLICNSIEESKAYMLHTLPQEYSDDNWIPFEEVKDGEKTALNDWAGKMVVFDKELCTGVPFYYKQSVQLISATKYHVVIWDPQLNEEKILNAKYADPGNWKLA